MQERLKKKIFNIVDGKLGEQELDLLLRLVDRRPSKLGAGDEGGFFKHLASEMRQEMKDLASLIMDFKRDLTCKIDPGISEVRAKYIPQAADQLQEIIRSTEKAANRIMDNLESMERHMAEAREMIEKLKQGLAGGLTHRDLDGWIESIRQRAEDSAALITDSFEQMSFQDLTGQRIKRTIDLVNLMEERLTKTLLSFGIKVTEKNRNPDLSGDELENAVEQKLSSLSGPQRAGEGMNQADIDRLLATM